MALLVGRFFLVPGLLVAAHLFVGVGNAAPGVKAIHAGLFLRQTNAETAYVAPVLASDVFIEVIAGIAKVTVRQRFRNPSKLWLEGVYVFPLPEKSAVDRLRLEVGGRLIEGEIQEREVAEKTFREAAKAGRSAALLSSKRPNVFSTAVANIAPGDEILVEIRYQDQVLLRDGSYSYRFPLVVAPYYTPNDPKPTVSAPSPFVDQDGVNRNVKFLAPSEEELSGGRDMFGPVRKPGTGFLNPVSIAIFLHGRNAKASVKSSNHAIDIQDLDSDLTLITLSEGPIPTDRDFVLSWKPTAESSPTASVFAEEWDGSRHFLVTVTPPDAGSWPDDRQPRDLILVLDKSGSMAGSAIDQAKTAAVTAISRLREADRFNVILFDDDAHSFFPSARSATSENVENILYGLDRVNGGGGTNLVGALREALRLQPAHGRLRQIVFLTDGASSEDEQFLRLLKRQLHRNRLFTVGVGAAPNSYLMVRAAQLGRGTYTYIDNASQIEEQMGALFRKLEKPALTDMKIAWRTGLGSEAEIYPSHLPDLYIGEPVSFLVRLPLATPYLASMSLEPMGNEIEVSGSLKGERWHQMVDISNVKPVAGVAALWAREKVADLKNRLRFEREDEETLRREIVPTALRYQLVTEYTSLVAVDRSTVSRPQNSSLHRSEIKRNLPFGMDYEKIWDQTVAPKMMHMAPVPSELLQDVSFRRAIGLPATASPAAERLVWGGILLLLGSLVCSVVVFGRLPSTEAIS